MKGDSSMTISDLKHIIREANKPNSRRAGANLKLTGSKKELQDRLKSVNRWREIKSSPKKAPVKKAKAAASVGSPPTIKGLTWKGMRADGLNVASPDNEIQTASYEWKDNKIVMIFGKRGKGNKYPVDLFKTLYARILNRQKTEKPSKTLAQKQREDPNAIGPASNPYGLK